MCMCFDCASTIIVTYVNMYLDQTSTNNRYLWIWYYTCTCVQHIDNAGHVLFCPSVGRWCSEWALSQLSILLYCPAHSVASATPSLMNSWGKLYSRSNYIFLCIHPASPYLMTTHQLPQATICIACITSLCLGITLLVFSWHSPDFPDNQPAHSEACH